MVVEGISVPGGIDEKVRLQNSLPGHRPPVGLVRCRCHPKPVGLLDDAANDSSSFCQSLNLGGVDLPVSFDHCRSDCQTVDRNELKVIHCRSKPRRAASANNGTFTRYFHRSPYRHTLRFEKRFAGATACGSC